jgi:hypothetical protein
MGGVEWDGGGDLAAPDSRDRFNGRRWHGTAKRTSPLPGFEGQARWGGFEGQVRWEGGARGGEEDLAAPGEGGLGCAG